MTRRTATDILVAVRKQPGLTAVRIAEITGCSATETREWLNVFEKSKLVRSKTVRNHLLSGRGQRYARGWYFTTDEEFRADSVREDIEALRYFSERVIANGRI